MNRLTIVVSGKKQSGKSTTCAFIAAKFLNRTRAIPHIYWMVSDSGKLLEFNAGMHDILTDTDFSGAGGCRIYSFADPLKRFCCDVLGAPEESCYGSDDDKNALISHLLWESLPQSLRPFEEPRGGTLSDNIGGHRLKSGPMTGRELMQVFGTDICRRLYGDCWAKGTYNTIKREGYSVALVCDGRFPNEIDIGASVQAKTIRLLRNVYKDEHRSETALDNYSLDRYTLVVDNRDMTLEQQLWHQETVVDQWLTEIGLPKRDCNGVSGVPPELYR